MQHRIDKRQRARALPYSVLCVAMVVNSLANVALAAPPTHERVEWNMVPVEVALKVGVERQIEFPASVKVGVPTSLKLKLRAQSVSDTVYLKATGAFDPTRLVIQTREGGRTYLLDVDASDSDIETPPIAIVDYESTEQHAARNPTPSITQATADPVTLTRFAAQQLYAPVRLLKPAPGIVRVPVPVEVFSLVRGGEVSAQPLIGWRSGERYVTAVKLRNVSTRPVVLDPRALRGAWLTAAFQHNRLLPAGSEADTTVVYLVSARPFAASR